MKLLNDVSKIIISYPLPCHKLSTGCTITSPHDMKQLRDATSTAPELLYLYRETNFLATSAGLRMHGCSFKDDFYVAMSSDA